MTTTKDRFDRDNPCNHPNGHECDCGAWCCIDCVDSSKVRGFHMGYPKGLADVVHDLEKLRDDMEDTHKHHSHLGGFSGKDVSELLDQIIKKWKAVL